MKTFVGSALSRSGVEKEVEDVQGSLRRLNSVLVYLDASKNKDNHVEKLERDIKHLVYVLEDALDIFLIRIKSRRVTGIQKNLTSFIYELSACRDFGLKVREINEIENPDIEKIPVARIAVAELMKNRDNSEEERSVSLKINCGWYRCFSFRARKAQTNEALVCTCQSAEEETETETDVVNLLDQIVKEDHQVICIYGMTGIGKTSLALKLYHHGKVRNTFESFAWINMNQKISRINVLRELLVHLDHASSTETLEITDKKVLLSKLSLEQQKKCLIVLDDMWSIDAWYFLCEALPSAKILLTTQEIEVADYIGTNERGGISYPMKPLNEKASWKLFLKVLEDRAKSAKNHQLLEIGYEIVKQCKGIPQQCKGIPQYIVAVADFLAKKNEPQEWKKLLQASVSSLPVIASSYDSLPYHLKLFFLYLGMFPKGLDIEVEHLYRLWMAEGIIILREDNEIVETRMDVAEKYLNELVQRKMISVKEDPSLRRYRSCQIHDLHHDLCLLKGKEFFFEVLDLSRKTQGGESLSSSDSSPSQTRRLVVYLSNQGNEADELENCKPTHHLRTLLVVNLNKLPLQCPQGLLDLTKFKTLRVLNFECIDFGVGGLPMGMTELIHLRYLSFRGCILKKLPKSICNLSFLLFLDLRVSCSMIIPNVLRKMQRLRHIYLPVVFQTGTNNKLDLCKLKQVETLVNFNTRVCNAADLSEMKNLLHLSATVEGNLNDLELIILRLNEKSKHGSLLHTSIKVNTFNCYTEERHSVFRELLNCKALHSLHMDGHLGYIRFRNEISSRLTEMVLKGSRLQKDPMTTFDKLPKLQVLVLQDNAYLGKEMKCSASSFGELKRLELLDLGFLETLEVETGAMPNLSLLAVKNCSRLNSQMPPVGLKHRYDPRITFEIDC